MKRIIVLALLIASAACAQIMPGIIDSQKNLPGWLSDPNFTCPVFNGVNQYAENSIPIATTTTSYTIMFWMKISSTHLLKR